MNSQSLDDLIARVNASVVDVAEAAPHEHLYAPPTVSPSHVHDTKSVLSSAGLSYFMQHIAHGARHSAHAYLLLTSDEFIEQAYRQGFRREADATGYANLNQQLAAGLPYLLALDILARSAEGQVSAPPWQFTRADRLLLALNRVAKRLRLARLMRPVWQIYEGMLRRDQLLELAAGLPAFIAEALAPLQQTQRQQAHLEMAMLRLARVSDQAASEVACVSDAELSAYYVAFEAANRGSQDEITAKLAPYTDWARALAEQAGQYPVLDIGCGRGEWLKWLQQHGLRATGLDINADMVALCQAQDLLAEQGHALAVLRTQPSDSLAAITAFHVIEHLAFPYLYALVAESIRCVRPGGSVLFETPNPENVLVGSHTFYHDFTHRNPITPAAITFLLSFHGFERISILRLNPYPAHAKVPGDDALTARVNGHFCGPQDFAVIAYRPAVSDA